MQYSFNPRFNHPILNGTKIHTFRHVRKDKRLPKVGKPLTFCNGARSKNYYRIPFKATCFGSQKMRMVIEKIERHGFIYPQVFDLNIKLHIGNKREFSKLELVEVAINDGFNGITDFCFYWLDGKRKVVFSGYCHHWTPFIYE